MMTRTIALALLLAAPALAADQAAPVAETTAPAPKKIIEVAGPALATPAATGEKIICKREVEIGSLVKGVRRCGTRSEWRKSSEAARKWTADIQDQKGAYVVH